MDIDKNIVTVVQISQINGVTLERTQANTVEDICNPKYLDYEAQQLHPPLPIFRKTYNNWLHHLSCAWTLHENDPSTDRDKFQTAPLEFQKIVLRNIACIMIGDSIVLDCIARDMLDTITSIELKAMFTDQSARELVHKATYSRMLELAQDSREYRTKEFCDQYMGRFQKLANMYRTNDIRIQMYFIMLCENILFAPMFQTICYLASLSYAPKVCDLNLLVMRDEYIHYKNARDQMAQFKYKIDTLLAKDILAEFVEVTTSLCVDIIGKYDDGVYNFDHVHDHLLHVVHAFNTENDLYLNYEEYAINEKLYGHSPAELYMNLTRNESKVNHMESNSTVYVTPGDNCTVDMSF